MLGPPLPEAVPAARPRESLALGGFERVRGRWCRRKVAGLGWVGWFAAPLVPPSRQNGRPIGHRRPKPRPPQYQKGTGPCSAATRHEHAVARHTRQIGRPRHPACFALRHVVQPHGICSRDERLLRCPFDPERMWPASPACVAPLFMCRSVPGASDSAATYASGGRASTSSSR